MDVFKLAQSDLLQIVNSFPDLGTVATSARVRRLREEAGLRIGDGQKTNLFRLALYLLSECDLSEVDADTKLTAAEKYAAKKERQIAKNRAATRMAQEIRIAECSDPELRAAVEQDLRLFLKTCFPERFYLEWSRNHLEAIEKAERSIKKKGLYALAMPRGDGKTTIVDGTSLWAVLNGYRKFLALLGAEQTSADERMDALKTELRHNDMLNALYPEVCNPIRELDGTAQKRLRHNGELITLQFTSDMIVLPVIPGSKASGSVIKTSGLTGRIRGMNYTQPGGRVVRPDYVILDDPQTDESARSPTQCDERERIISGAVLGLAAADTVISGVMPCTVIRPGDLADRILDTKRHPEWDSSRLPLVYQWPKNERLWEEYARILTESEGNRYERQERATAFYRDHRAAMDEGAEVAWEQRYDRDLQISALQYAYDWKIRDAVAFASEAQQSPLADTAKTSSLKVSELIQRLNGLARGLVPHGTACLTMFVDIQGNSLWYVVVAWRHDFSGSVVDYGVWPEQPAGATLRLNKLINTLLTDPAAQGSLEASIHLGLTGLLNHIVGRKWPIDGGGERMIDRCLIDANWNKSTEIVYQLVRGHQLRPVIYPSHGIGLTGKQRPFSEYAQSPTERNGLEWRLIRNYTKRPVPYVLIDTNFWKSFIADRLTTPAGGSGALMLFGEQDGDFSGMEHERFAGHLTAEYSTPDDAARKVDIWKLPPGGDDNHWFDGLVGCAVAASIEGITLPELAAPRKSGPRKTLRQLALEAGAAR